jgi:hypothetical protein
MSSIPFGQPGVITGVTDNLCECYFSNNQIVKVKPLEIWNKKWKLSDLNFDN